MRTVDLHLVCGLFALAAAAIAQSAAPAAPEQDPLARLHAGTQQIPNAVAEAKDRKSVV